jgi:hypothetical protein
MFAVPGRLTVVAYAGGVQVDQSSIRVGFAARHSVTVQASAIDTVKLSGLSVALVQVCYVPCERCEDHKAGGWEELRDSICLPICYSDDPCKEPYDDNDCEWLNVEDRLPDDRCIRAKYGGEKAKELVSVLRTLVNPEGPVAQADRFMGGPGVAGDCPPPGQRQPTLNFRALDAVLLAATDPVIAKVLGLYYVDDKAEAGTPYDYKIVGDWPEGTLWHLTESLSFDHLPIRHRFPLNVFPVGELTFRTGPRPTIIHKPSKPAGTKNALSFRHTDVFDWNLPGLTNLPVSKFPETQGEIQVEIRFPEAVGEVQVHLGHGISNVLLEAWFDTPGQQEKVANDVVSTRREDVIAVHADQKIFNRIVLKGKDFWIYKICWQEERIPHGEHCAFVYGLRMEDAKPLAPPQNPKAFVLPGIVQKVADCRPLMEGETVDARYSVGVHWELPLMQNQLLPKSPIRYHVRRIAQDGTENLLTEDSPVFVTPANQDVEKARKENLPEGWPQDTPYYVESSLEPGEYRYQVAGVDLFGRMSDFSAPSNAVSPVPLPPPSPPNVTARFIDGKDPWLSKEDRDALPQGIADAVAIRLRWNWPEDYERMAPDVQTFKVYYLPGVPNILFGNVIDIDIDNATSTYVDIEAEIEGLGTALAPENLLVGRLLNQGGKAFRILTHREGIAQYSKQVLVARLLLPPSPPENRPVEGDCSIALAASIAIEVSDFSESGGDINAVIKSTAIHAVPHSGLETSRLTIGQIEAVIDAVNRATLTDGHFELEVQLTIAEPDKKELFLSIPTPFFARLSLTEPGTGIYKDYSKAISWPTALSETIPKIGTGQYDLLMREKVSGETPGLIATDPGEYTLIVDQFLPGFDVHLDNPRFESHFGISATGQGGEGPVSMPAGITRICRGDKKKQEEVLTTLRPLIAPEDFALEGPPNFEGKLTYEFSWTRTAGWRYEVYRALDDTIFKVDNSNREDIAAAKSSPRFSGPQEKQDWLDNFQLSGATDLHTVIESLIIDPQAIDLTAIEDHNYKNILLQALASLPFNDRVFTKLDDKYVKPDEADPDNKVICIDDSIEGRAKGRYFYRVQAIDSVGNAASMAVSMRPIYVKGDQRPATPVITAVEGGDRQITIRWTAVPNSNLKEYKIYRTNDLEKVRDVRLMSPPVHIESVPTSGTIPSEFWWVDRSVDPYKRTLYRIVAVDIKGKDSIPSNIITSQAYDYSTPTEPNWERSEWIKLDENGNEHPFGSAGPNLTRAIALVVTTPQEGVQMLIQRGESTGWVPIESWITATRWDANSTVWRYELYDKEVKPVQEQRYKVILLSRAGIRLESEIEQTVPLPI